MINKNSSWNLNVKNYIHKIKILDELLYNIMKPYMFTKINDTYIQYNNDYSSFDATKLHYFNQPSQKLIDEIKRGLTIENILIKESNLLEATKYLKKGYYEKYIKYKTKYLNLKNT